MQLPDVDSRVCEIIRRDPPVDRGLNDHESLAVNGQFKIELITEGRIGVS